MARGARVDRGLAPLARLGQMPVNSDVRRHVAFAQSNNELCDVVGLICTEGDAPRTWTAAIDQRQGFLALSRSGRLTEPSLHQ